MADRDDVRVLCGILCPPERVDLGRRLERAFYRRGWPKLKYAAEFRDADHPRGQPENAGWFAAKGNETGGDDPKGAADDREQDAPTTAMRHAFLRQFEGWLSASTQVAPHRAADYSKAADAATRRLGPEGMKKLSENVKLADFHESLKSLNAARGHLVPADMTLLGSYSSREEKLYLDGGSDTGQRCPFKAAEIYAHEFGHAIDKERDFSRDPEFKKAFKSDTKNNELSAYAKMGSKEWFAEFARVALTDPARAADKFPACLDYWRRKGLTI